MKYFYKPSYLKAFDRLNRKQQEQVIKTDALIKKYLETREFHFGLRVKTLRENIQEGRVNDAIRILWVKQKEEVTFTLVGNHEEVRRFLKNF
ncbi:MAG: hypothetical protein JNK65_03390 [Deltaproteobacteria bacterium]|nr:hypothetical protein [Deltaproteobacteria bacterium]